MDTQNFLEQLNDSQRQAVEYCDGPSLVIAGAGSGKTRVLTYKVAYLLQLGYKPWSLLALTFTNKAAGEMKQRIANIVGEKLAAYLNMGTFHSIFARILRTEAGHVGYGGNYTIYDETDSRALLKNIIKEMKLDDTKYKPAAVHNVISLAKNRLITPEMYEKDREARDRDNSENRPLLYQVYIEYALRCRQANAMDFDDLLLNTYILFNTNEDVRRKYVDRFEFVLVDEYQDTNYAQQQIVYLLTKERQRVCVVGDDAQSIYSFRGANIENILGFQKLYDDTRLFKLERNYRSTQQIVNAANSLIKHNERQIKKDVYSKKEVGDAVIYQPLYSDKEEVIVVAKYIKSIMREENCGYDDFAILYRTNAQSRPFEEQLRKEGIPYRIFGGLSFYQRKEIKDVIAYFRLVVNPDDEEALRRVINYPTRGIGNVTYEKITQKARSQGSSLWQVVCHPEDAGLSKATSGKIDRFRQLIEQFRHQLTTDDVFTLGTNIIKQTGIANDIALDTSPEGMARKENIDELLNGMKDFVDSRREEGNNGVFLADFLQEVSLLTDLDGGDEEEEKGRVALMTVHSAKGLEFSTVFIVGMEENIFPNSMASTSKKEIEEERRLFYVAITRAEKHCIITSAQHRLRYGRPEFNSRSRFINDIDFKFVDVVGSSGPSMTRGGSQWGRGEKDAWRPRVTVDPRPFNVEKKKRGWGTTSPVSPKPSSSATPDSSSSGTSSPPPSGLREGCVIEHQRFGIGNVVKMEGRGENLKITVQFRYGGQKILLVKFAKFKVIE
ncbi:MAG: UvrD-helicase domain-containing protein [Prevotella sp.]|nr:UvrD-helicase domain-containing protein [Prevotella sp.]